MGSVRPLSLEKLLDSSSEYSRESDILHETHPGSNLGSSTFCQMTLEPQFPCLTMGRKGLALQRAGGVYNLERWGVAKQQQCLSPRRSSEMVAGLLLWGFQAKLKGPDLIMNVLETTGRLKRGELQRNDLIRLWERLFWLLSGEQTGGVRSGNGGPGRGLLWTWLRDR